MIQLKYRLSFLAIYLIDCTIVHELCYAIYLRVSLFSDKA